MTTILSILLIAALIIAILCDIIRIRQYIAMRKEVSKEYKCKVVKNIGNMFYNYCNNHSYCGYSDIESYLYHHFNDIFE